MTDHGFYDNTSGALLSDDRRYRYRLWRTWNDHEPAVAFIMLNPSTVDETENDHTIKRCIDYAKRWGFGTLIVGNLFALRATNPDELYEHPKPIGPENDAHLEEIADEAHKVIAAWGTRGDYMDRNQEVGELLDELYALDTSKNGHPNHPSRQPADIEPESFEV